MMKILALALLILAGCAHPTPSSVRDRTPSGSQICSPLFGDAVQSLASEGKPSTLDWLRRLTPKISDKDFQAKLKACKDPSLLFRSFVAAFYDHIKTDPKIQAQLKPLLRFVGWMFGDAHIENSGALIIRGGGAIFSVNDLDDGGRGPVVLDVVRLLTSAKIEGVDIETKTVIKAYLRGLKGKKAKKSEFIEDLLEEAEAAGNEAPRSLFDPETERLSRSKAETRELSKELHGQLKKLLENEFPDRFNFYDAVEAINLDGGSGGLTRYHVLLRRIKESGEEGRWVVLEFKEMTRSGMAPVSPGRPPTTRERVDNGLKYTQGDDALKLYRFVKVGGLSMILRPRYRGIRKVDLQELYPDEQWELVRHEAWTFGMLHSQTVEGLERYIKAIENFPLEDFEAVSSQLVRTFNSLHRELRGNRP